MNPPILRNKGHYRDINTVHQFPPELILPVWNANAKKRWSNLSVCRIANQDSNLPVVMPWAIYLIMMQSMQFNFYNNDPKTLTAFN